MINKLNSEYQIQWNDTVITLEYDHIEHTFGFWDVHGNQLKFDDFSTISDAEDLLDALRLGVQLAAKLYGQPIEVDIESPAEESKDLCTEPDTDIKMAPDLERFLKEKGLYNRAIECTRKRFYNPEDIHTCLASMFDWDKTDEGHVYWSDFNDEYTRWSES